jgi:hypothetical protein
MIQNIFFISLFCFLNISSYSQDKRLALVIGNGDYQYASSLSNSANDAEAISEILQLLGFDVQKHQNSSQKDMKRAIDYFGEQLKNYDVGLFYFAGHGLQLDGYNYLISVDANIKSEGDIEYDCVNAGRILTKMEESGAKTNIVILDACRNNPFEKSWSRSVKNKGLAFMEAPTGSLIAYATSPGNTASDGSGENGLYTTSLLQYIGDPELNLLQVLQLTRKNVREESNGDQVPWESTSLEDDFYFNQIDSHIITLNEKDSEKAANKTSASQRNAFSLIEQIKSDDKNIWSEGVGVSVFDANKDAKADINNKIIKLFSDKLNSNYLEKHSISPLVIEKFQNQIITDLQPFIARKAYQSGKTQNIVRYIPKDEIDKYLEIKENRIHSFYQDGAEAEKTNEIGDALKYYYWTYVLTIAHPEQERIYLKEGSNIPAVTFLTQKIDKILSDLSYTVTDSIIVKDMKRFIIGFSYNNKPVENVDFRYWNGVTWSEINCINNGIGLIEIYPEYNRNDVKINIEYKYKNKAKFDKTLQKFVEILDYNRFNTLCSSLKDVPSQLTSITQPEFNFSVENPEEYQGIVDKVIEKVQNEDKTYDPELFTREGFEVYKKLLLYSNASFFIKTKDYNVSGFLDQKYIRDIPVKFSARNNDVVFVEKLSFQLDTANRINSISFTLSDAATSDILSHTKWPDESKWQIINFLENYKTAYALKRYDYIDKIFSNNALIIVGQKIEEAKFSDSYNYSLSGEKYKFTRLSKEQYMYRLRRVFKKNEFINIQFEDNIVMKRDNKSDIYGINIKQNYFSSTYADQGYLFLMVDMADTNNPIIHVRAWQPDKFDDGHIIGLSDFTY